MRYKVTVHVLTPYSTIVEADNEDEAIALAMDREGPTEYAHLEDEQETEWASDGVMEFPNLGRNETPDVEEYE